jgi:hypothetical protein
MPYKNYYPCKMQDCDKPIRGKGLCSGHYKRLTTHGDPEVVMRKGRFAEQPICIIENCETKHTALGFCQAHYRAFKTFCDKDRWPEKRSKISNTTQARYITVYTPNHPFSTKQGMVLQHRLVMEQILGRYLERHENVHHKNGDRTDNSPENLELWSVVQPSGQRAEDKVKYAIEILELYAPELLAKVGA